MRFPFLFLCGSQLFKGLNIPLCCQVSLIFAEKTTFRMRKNQLLSICLVFCGLVVTGCKTTQHLNKSNSDKNIVILFDNDVHCALESYPKLAGLRDAIKDTAFVGIVSNGDYLQGGTMGAISKGKYVTEVMKTVGYDALTLGNHEFDYKMPRLLELMKGFPVVNANLQDNKTKNFVFSPYIVKTYGNKKIAFIGATTPTTRVTEEYAFVDEKGNELYNLNPDRLSQLVQDAANSARAAGADYVIVLSHLGEEPTEFNSDSHTLIRNTTNIDAVLDGHTHAVIPGDTVHNKQGKPVLIAQTGTKFANVGKLFINKEGKMSISLVPIAGIDRENAAVRKAYDVVNAQCRTFTEKVLGKNAADLLVQDINSVNVIRISETNAGDLVCDAILDYSKADIAMINGGGIRTTIPAGELTYGDVMDLVPYDDKMVVVRVSGKKIKELLTACIQSLPLADGDFPQVAGISFEVDGTRHTVSNVEVMNKQTKVYEPIVDDRTYLLAVQDYTFSGGGFKGLLKNSEVVATDSKTASDLVVRYVRDVLKGDIGQDYMRPKGRITIKY